MKLTVLLLLSVAAISSAADEAATQKRLQSVTWDLKNHKLTWVVQKGNVGNDGEFTSKATDQYEILPDQATMEFDGEKRGFTKEEAASLHKLLNTLSVYCAESVVWWDRGEGERMENKPNGKRVKVRDEKPASPKRPSFIRLASATDEPF